MNKLVAMGECLVDFLPRGGMAFEAKAGGAPANVCACVARLGAPAFYMGNMSDDLFGRFLYGELKKYGVSVDFVKITSDPTALAFVKLDERGDREFSFYRRNTADMLFYPEDIPSGLFDKGDILHFCSVALCESPTKRAHKQAVCEAREAGAVVSFDVNVRLPLWKDEEELRDAVFEFLPFADIVKVSEEELSFLTEGAEETHAVTALFTVAKNAKLIFVTKGADGASVYDREGGGVTKSAVQAEAVDTTGAGDCFIGCVLYKLLTGEGSLSLNGIGNAFDAALKGAAVVIGKKGAMESMPRLIDICKE